MQDRLNQKWRDTMALLGRDFTKEERAAGWPDSFKPESIAVLQRPFKWWPLKDREHEKGALCAAYRDGLNAALASGELSGIATTVTVTPPAPPIQRRNEFASSEWSNEFGRGFGFANGRVSMTPRAATPYEKTTYTVTAPAFAAWLTAQGETPSEHVKNWFDAVGVAGAAVAPVAVANSTPPDEAAEDKELRWLNHLETEQKSNPRGALARSASHFGIERSTFGYATKRAKEARAIRYRADIKAVPKKGSASVFDGLVTTVRDGRKAKTK